MKQLSSKITSLLFTTMIAAFLFTSCKSKNSDADIQAAITEKASKNQEMSGLTASVTNGVVTLNGQCKDEECKKDCEDAVKGISGVKQVVNNITVPTAQAPVEIAPDNTLQAGVNEVIKNYKGVTAEVNNGVVTLRGEIKRDDLKDLRIALDALKPKKIENQLVVK